MNAKINGPSPAPQATETIIKAGERAEKLRGEIAQVSKISPAILNTPPVEFAIAEIRALGLKFERDYKLDGSTFELAIPSLKLCFDFQPLGKSSNEMAADLDEAKVAKVKAAGWCYLSVWPTEPGWEVYEEIIERRGKLYGDTVWRRNSGPSDDMWHFEAWLPVAGPAHFTDRLVQPNPFEIEKVPVAGPFVHSYLTLSLNSSQTPQVDADGCLDGVTCVGMKLQTFTAAWERRKEQVAAYLNQCPKKFGE